MLSPNRVEVLSLQLVAEEYKIRVGRRIREARKAKQWSQARLARELPETIDGPSVSRWERGLVTPGTENLDALAQALDVDVSYFLMDEPQPGTADLMGTLDRSGEKDLLPLTRYLVEIVEKVSQQNEQLLERLRRIEGEDKPGGTGH